MATKEMKWTKEERKAQRELMSLGFRFYRDRNNEYVIFKLTRSQNGEKKYDDIMKSCDLDSIFDFIKTKKEQMGKGTYKEIKGNLITLAEDGEFDAIAHGCNCFATFGAGIAPQIGKAFPDSQLADQNLPLTDLQRLGNFSKGEEIFTKIGKNNEEEFNLLLIFNLYTQYMPGPDMQIEALTLAFRKMAMDLNERKNLSNRILKIGLPQIGCGIGGGDWDEVSKIIRTELKDFDVTVVIWDRTLHNNHQQQFKI